MINTGDLVQFSNFVVAKSASHAFRGDHITEVGALGIVTSCDTFGDDAAILGLRDSLIPSEVELEILVGDTVLDGIDPEDVTVINHGGKDVEQ